MASKKIKLPKWVNVSGRKIPIRYLSPEEVEAQNPGAGGWFNQWEREICISSDAPDHVKLYWIFHETAHASQLFSGISQTLPTEFEEVICQSTATLIEDILNSELANVYKDVWRKKNKK